MHISFIKNIIIIHVFPYALPYDQETQNAVFKKLEEKERELKQQAVKHQKEIQQVIKEYEDKVSQMFLFCILIS